ncbi:MAG: hypothetical protein GF388_11205 [Candidatus Aegiribacteria sp.]|nr:hypothetical protein [Candidatus Aegiribacteria sp.]MBD3295563.1 hypothetical protein [Candidatus Fermentibacteria bacterium]
MAMAEIICLLEDSSAAAKQLSEMIGDSMDVNVEIVLTDPGHMKVLNSRYRHMNRPTDVLSFDLSDDPHQRPVGIIFVDGRLYPPMEELLERICHGYLHLMGHTHDTPEDTREMSEKVSEMMRGILGDRERSRC